MIFRYTKVYLFYYTKNRIATFKLLTIMHLVFSSSVLLLQLKTLINTKQAKKWLHGASHLSTAILLQFQFHMYGFYACANIKCVPG